MKKIAIWGVIILAVAALIWQASSTLATLKSLSATIREETARTAALEKANADLTAKAAAIDKRNAALEEKVARGDEEKVQYKAQRDSALAQVEDLKSKILDGKPEYVLAEHQRILETREVWLTKDGAGFTLAAFRKNGSILVEWEKWKITVIPNLQADLAKTEGQVVDLRTEVSNFKLKDLNWEEQKKNWTATVAEKDKTISAQALTIAAQKKEELYMTLLKFSLGLALGLAVK